MKKRKLLTSMLLIGGAVTLATGCNKKPAPEEPSTTPVTSQPVTSTPVTSAPVTSQPTTSEEELEEDEVSLVMDFPSEKVKKEYKYGEKFSTEGITATIHTEYADGRPASDEAVNEFEYSIFTDEALENKVDELGACGTYYVTFKVGDLEASTNYTLRIEVIPVYAFADAVSYYPKETATKFLEEKTLIEDEYGNKIAATASGEKDAKIDANTKYDPENNSRKWEFRINEGGSPLKNDKDLGCNKIKITITKTSTIKLYVLSSSKSYDSEGNPSSNRNIRVTGENYTENFMIKGAVKDAYGNDCTDLIVLRDLAPGTYEVFTAGSGVAGSWYCWNIDIINQVDTNAEDVSLVSAGVVFNEKYVPNMTLNCNEGGNLEFDNATINAIYGFNDQNRYNLEIDPSEVTFYEDQDCTKPFDSSIFGARQIYMKLADLNAVPVQVKVRPNADHIENEEIAIKDESKHQVSFKQGEAFNFDDLLITRTVVTTSSTAGNTIVDNVIVDATKYDVVVENGSPVSAEDFKTLAHGTYTVRVTAKDNQDVTLFYTIAVLEIDQKETEWTPTTVTEVKVGSTSIVPAGAKLTIKYKKIGRETVGETTTYYEVNDVVVSTGNLRVNYYSDESRTTEITDISTLPVGTKVYSRLSYEGVTEKLDFEVTIVSNLTEVFAFENYGKADLISTLAPRFVVTGAGFKESDSSVTNIQFDKKGGHSTNPNSGDQLTQYLKITLTKTSTVSFELECTTSGAAGLFSLRKADSINDVNPITNSQVIKPTGDYKLSLVASKTTVVYTLDAATYFFASLVEKSADYNDITEVTAGSVTTTLKAASGKNIRLYSIKVLETE